MLWKQSKTICFMKSESVVDHSRVTRWFKKFEFKLQSCYYILFWTNNTLGEKYDSPCTSSYGLDCTTTVLQGWFWH